MPFTNDSTPDLIAKSASVVHALTPEVYTYLLSLLPTPETIQANHNRITASYSAFLAGDTQKGKDCEADRLAVTEFLTILHGVAKAVTIKDPKVSEVLGLGPNQSKAAPSQISLPAPQGFKVVYNREGELVASVGSVAHAKAYEIWVCDGDPNLESNWKLLTQSFTCKGVILTGVDRAKPNWLKVRAKGAKAKEGPWSSLITLPPK